MEGKVKVKRSMKTTQIRLAKIVQGLMTLMLPLEKNAVSFYEYVTLVLRMASKNISPHMAARMIKYLIVPVYMTLDTSLLSPFVKYYVTALSIYSSLLEMNKDVRLMKFSVK